LHIENHAMTHGREKYQLPILIVMNKNIDTGV